MKTSARNLLITTMASAAIWTASFASGIWSATALTNDASHLPTWQLLGIFPPATTLSIMRNNLFAIFLCWSGLFTFGISAITTVGASGIVAGTVMGGALQGGMPWREFLCLTLPHSFELIGLWLAGGIGLLGIPLSRTLYSKNKVSLLEYWKLIAKIGVIALVLTITAACIEGEITINHFGEYRVGSLHPP